MVTLFNMDSYGTPAVLENPIFTGLYRSKHFNHFAVIITVSVHILENKCYRQFCDKLRRYSRQFSFHNPRVFLRPFCQGRISKVRQQKNTRFLCRTRSPWRRVSIRFENLYRDLHIYVRALQSTIHYTVHTVTL